VTRRFGSFAALDDVSLTVAPGEFLTLLGPSGSGKTTLLGSIAGFQTIDAGRILVDGVPIQDTPPHRRGFGMVFQSYALFPHMTVGQNVAFPLRMQGVGRAGAEARVRETLDILKLGSFADRLPSQLSGGQQQRVAIARAIVKRPKIVLMDEPLSALDRRLREAIQLEIRDLHRRIGTTIVFVTHDQGEALALSDRVAVLDAGKIVQIGTPKELYHRPANAFVAGFVGESNILRATVTRCHDRTVDLDSAGLVFAAPSAGRGFRPGEAVSVVVRPERIAIVPDGQPALATAEVVGTVNLGEILRIDARLPDGQALQIRCLDAHVMPDVRPGERIRLFWTADDCWVLA
jgi:putative spermidine/putrescine transport system ATP-binding protein